jgi:hypothetical protein
MTLGQYRFNQGFIGQVMGSQKPDTLQEPTPKAPTKATLASPQTRSNRTSETPAINGLHLSIIGQHRPHNFGG